LFERELQDAKNSKFIESVLSVSESNESAKEECHEEDVDPKGVMQTQEVEFEETWDSILADYRNTLKNLREMEDSSEYEFKVYLEENYNVPTRKQQ